MRRIMISFTLAIATLAVCASGAMALPPYNWSMPDPFYYLPFAQACAEWSPNNYIEYQSNDWCGAPANVDVTASNPHQRIWLIHNKTTGAITVQEWDEAANTLLWAPSMVLGYG